MRKDKLKDMVRSILPSKNSEAAREAKAATNRMHRRGIHEALRHDDGGSRATAIAPPFVSGALYGSTPTPTLGSTR